MLKLFRPSTYTNLRSVLVRSYLNKYGVHTDVKKSPPISPPIGCCGSGCQNCVWLQYADDLLKYYGDSVSKENLEKVLMDEINKLEDENSKAFLLFELKLKLKV